MSVPPVNGIVNNDLTTPAHTSVTPCLKSFLSLLLFNRLVADLCPKFCSQLKRDHAWLFGCHKSSLMSAWRLASLSLAHGVSSDTSDQYRGVWHTFQRTARDPSLSISGVLNGGLVAGLFGWISASPPQPHVFSVCALTLSCLRPVLRVSRSLLSNVSSPPTFYPEIQPLFCVNHILSKMCSTNCSTETSF